MKSYPMKEGWPAVCRLALGRLTLVGACLLAFGTTMAVVGCQKSETDDAARVTPPERGAAAPSQQPAAETPDDAPGAIELPADADLNQDTNLPAAPTQDPATAPGGLEMPSDALPNAIPPNDGSSANPGG